MDSRLGQKTGPMWTSTVLLLQRHHGGKPTTEHFAVYRKTAAKVSSLAAENPSHLRQLTGGCGRPFKGAARENFRRPSARTSRAMLRVSLRHLSAIKSSLGGQQAQVQANSPTLLRSLLRPTAPPPPHLLPNEGTRDVYFLSSSRQDSVLLT